MPPSCLYKSLLFLHRPSLVDASARSAPTVKKFTFTKNRISTQGRMRLPTPCNIASIYVRKGRLLTGPLSKSSPSHRMSISTPIISPVEPTTPIPNVSVSCTPISGQIHMHNRFLPPFVITVDLIMVRGVGRGCVARSAWSRSRIPLWRALGLGLCVSLL